MMSGCVFTRMCVNIHFTHAYDKEKKIKTCVSNIEDTHDTRVEKPPPDDNTSPTTVYPERNSCADVLICVYICVSACLLV